MCWHGTQYMDPIQNTYSRNNIHYYNPTCIGSFVGKCDILKMHLYVYSRSFNNLLKHTSRVWAVWRTLESLVSGKRVKAILWQPVFYKLFWLPWGVLVCLSLPEDVLACLSVCSHCWFEWLLYLDVALIACQIRLRALRWEDSTG